MGTLVHDPFYTDVAPLFGLTFEELIEQKHPTRWIDFECGRISESEMLADFFLDRRPVDGERLRRAMVAGYDWLPGMESLLHELKARGVEMHLFSNYPHWYRWIEDKLEVSRFASWSFVSWDTGLHKPDPAAYAHVANELGRSPDECLFIDDREVNCTGAERVGMPAIHFLDETSLRAAIEKMGLLESSDRSGV